jgi:hypothetical protein
MQPNDNDEQPVQTNLEARGKVIETKKRDVSLQKIEANHRNSKNSTRPKTVKGKKTVSRNALKHGFLSRVVVIKDQDGGESQAEFDQLHATFREDQQPVGAAQEAFLEDMVSARWRKRRALRYENGVISDRFSNRRDAIKTRPETERLWGKSHLLPLSPERQRELDTRSDYLCMPERLDLIVRYETMIDKQFYRAFAMLQQSQQRRKSAGIGLPQVDGAGAVAEEPGEPQTQEVNSDDAGDLAPVDGTIPSAEACQSQTQQPNEEDERFYQTKPTSPLSSD